MKLKVVLGFLFFSITTLSISFAQDDDSDDETQTAIGKYGASAEDSIECVKNYSLYTEFYKQKNFKDAFKYWNGVITYCPKLSKSLYQKGDKMIDAFIKVEKNEVRKNRLIDSLLWLYDQRIEHYGQEGFVLGRKGNDMLKYREDNPKAAYDVLKKSYDLQGRKTEAGVLLSLYRSVYLMYKKEEATKEELLEWYPKVSEIITFQLTNAKKESTKKAAIGAGGNIDKIFTAVAGCEDLIGFFKPKFEANPDDTTLLKNITKLLDKKECTDDELFFNAAAKLHELNPSAESAYAIGINQKDNCGNAAEYFVQAAELAKDNELKVKALLKAAKCYLKVGQYSKSRKYAQQAATTNPSSGEPYLIIGSAYAASAGQCGDNNCTKKAAYWVAVDQFYKAKSVDPSIAEEANSKIASYSKHFPGKEDCFFYNITEGSTYTVECWINESTKVRFN